MVENPYDVLGIAASATPAEVKRAYRRKVLQCHPDAVGVGREGEFRRVQEAYEEIETPEKGGGTPQTAPWSTQPPTWPSSVHRPPLSPQLELELDRDEARSGLSLLVPLAIEMPCSYCADAGILRLFCSRCGGWGHVRTRLRVRVHVPPGVRDGDELCARATLEDGGIVTILLLVRVARH